MKRATENKIILVVRRTRVDDLKARFNTVGQAKFYIEHLGADFSDYLREEEVYENAETLVEECLRQFGRVHVLDRAFLPNFVFGEQDMIVVLGQDGLVANTVKYLNGQQVIGVNPDPQRYDGVLLPFRVNELPRVVPEVFAKRRPVKEVTLAKATLNTGQVLYGVNDLFIGQKSHISARYEIRLGRVQEQHSSSGIVISTGLGSTGWFKSLLTGALQIVQALQGEPTDYKDKKINTDKKQSHSHQFAWDADYLYFTVREPFLSAMSSVNLVFGKITIQQPLVLVSQMAENGVIFSDGIENDFLEFNSGTQATIGLAEKRGYLVI